MNVLITGAGGFIGSFLVDSISSDSKFNVYALFSPWDQLKLRSKSHKNVQEIKIDISNTQNLTELFVKFSFDTVIHCAFITDTSVQSQSVKKFDIEKVNIFSSIKLIEFSIKYAVKRFVFFSSAGIYKNQKKGLLNCETDSIMLRNDYFKHKLAVEKSISHHKGLQDKTNFVILRLGTIFSENESNSSTRPNTSLIHQLLYYYKKNNFIRLNDVSVFRDFFYIHNLTSLIHSILAIKKYDHLIYNVGSNQSFSVVDLFQILSRNEINFNYYITSKDKSDIIVNSSQNRAPLNTNRIIDSFGFKANFSFEESIVKTFTNLVRGY